MRSASRSVFVSWQFYFFWAVLLFIVFGFIVPALSLLPFTRIRCQRTKSRSSCVGISHRVETYIHRMFGMHLPAHEKRGAGNKWTVPILQYFIAIFLDLELPSNRFKLEPNLYCDKRIDWRPSTRSIRFTISGTHIDVARVNTTGKQQTSDRHKRHGLRYLCVLSLSLRFQPIFPFSKLHRLLDGVLSAVSVVLW